MLIDVIVHLIRQGGAVDMSVNLPDVTKTKGRVAMWYLFHPKVRGIRPISGGFYVASGKRKSTRLFYEAQKELLQKTNFATAIFLHLPNKPRVLY